MTGYFPAPHAPGPVALRAYRFLARLGFDPGFRHIGEPSTQVWFQARGRVFVMMVDEKDEQFCQVCTGWDIAHLGRSELELLRVAHEIQATMKVVKVVFGEGQRCVEFQVPLLRASKPFRRELLERATEILLDVSREFHVRLALDPAHLAARA